MQTSSLAGSQHVDHLIQASLQRAEDLPSSLLLPAVSRYSQVQRPGPAEDVGSKRHVFFQMPVHVGLDAGNSPSLGTEGQNSDVGNLRILQRSLLIVIFIAAVDT